jgi:hypothetical protein
MENHDSFAKPVFISTWYLYNYLMLSLLFHGGAYHHDKQAAISSQREHNYQSSSYLMALLV